MNATVGIHAVTPLIQSTEISSSEQTKGQNDGTSAGQRKVGLLWKGTEESDPHGKISWVKVAEVWALNKDLAPWNKSSLSSSSNDGNPQTQILTSAPATPDVDNVNNNNNSNGDAERNDGNGGSPDEPNNTEVEEEDETNKVRRIFLNFLRKSRKLGCWEYRRSAKKVNSKNIGPLLKIVDDLIKEELAKSSQITWNQLSISIYAGALTVDKIANQLNAEKQEKAKK